MFPYYKSLFEICRLLSYWPANLKFCPAFHHLLALYIRDNLYIKIMYHPLSMFHAGTSVKITGQQ